MTMCDEVRWRLVRPDGTGECDITRSEWDFSVPRNGLPVASVEIDSCLCDPTQFEPLCDYLEVWQGGSLMARFLYRTSEPAGSSALEIGGVGLTAQSQFTQWGTTEVLSGPASYIWQQAWAPLFLTPGIPAGGRPVTFNVEGKDQRSDLISTMDSYVTWSEHGGALYDWVAGEEPFGTEMLPDYFINEDCGVIGEDGSSVVDEVTVCYGSELALIKRWPPAVGGCGRQSPPLEYPEITDPDTACSVAEDAYEILRFPQRVFDRQAELDARKVCWEDLIPGRRHRVRGEVFGLGSVRVSGTGGCVESVEAAFDQAEIAALRSRVAVRA